MTKDLDKPTETVSRARIRVAEIVRLMAGGEWLRGESHKPLAEMHGIKPQTVQNEASVVSHVLDVLFDSRDVWAERINSRVDAIVDRFAASTDPGEASVALTGLRDLAKNTGVSSRFDKAPTTNVTVNMSGVSDGGLLDKLRAALREPDELTAQAMLLEADAIRRLLDSRATIETEGEDA